jgi:hypothetical protein
MSLPHDLNNTYVNIVLKGDGLGEHHNIPIEAESPTKKEKAKDLRLIFTDLVTVKFLRKNDTPETKRGWWCNTCR